MCNRGINDTITITITNTTIFVKKWTITITNTIVIYKKKFDCSYDYQIDFVNNRLLFSAFFLIASNLASLYIPKRKYKIAAIHNYY